MLADELTKSLFTVLFGLFVNTIKMIKMHRKDAWLNALLKAFKKWLLNDY